MPSPATRDPAGAVIVAALPVGVAGDGRDLGGLGADLVRGGAGADREDERGRDPVRVR